MDNILGPCNDVGGELYLLSFGLDCGNDGKTYYYWHLPNCLANCNELFFDAMLNENSAGDCTYYKVDAVIVYGDGEDEDDDANEEDNNSTGGAVCAQVIDETYAQMAYLTLFISLEDSISCEDKSQTICTIDLADELEGGKITTLLPFCTNAGGDLYISTFSIDCGDNGITTIKNFPFCISNCNVNYLKELIFYVGGNAGSDAGDLLGIGNGDHDDNDEGQKEDKGCIFSAVDEIYRYSSDKEDEDEPGNHHDDRDHHDEGDDHHDDHDHHDEGDDHHDDHDHHDEGDDHHEDNDHHNEDNHDYHDGDDSHDYHDHDQDNGTDHQSPKAPKATKALKMNKIKKTGKKFKKYRNSKQA